MDSAIVVIVIVAVTGAFAARFILLRWQYRRTAMKILKLFGESGAIVPTRARQLEELGLSLRGRVIGLKDYRPAVLVGLMQNGMIAGTEDGKFYLSEEGYQFYTNHCR